MIISKSVTVGKGNKYFGCNFFVEVLKLFKQGTILLKCIQFDVIILIFGNKCKMANVSIIANLFWAQINLKKKENSL